MTTEYRLGHVNPNEMRTVNVFVRSTTPMDDILADAKVKILEAKRQLKIDRRKLIAQRAQMQGLTLDNLNVEITDSGEIIARPKVDITTDDEALF